MSLALKDLARRARQAESDRELGFLLVNETLALAPYRQAALWLADEGVWSLSGVVQVDAHVPYANGSMPWRSTFMSRDVPWSSPSQPAICPMTWRLNGASGGQPMRCGLVVVPMG